MESRAIRKNHISFLMPSSIHFFGYFYFVKRLLGIGLFNQINIELMFWLGVRGQYVGGIAEPTSLP